MKTRLENTLTGLGSVEKKKRVSGGGKETRDRARGGGRGTARGATVIKQK